MCLEELLYNFCVFVLCLLACLLYICGLLGYFVCLLVCSFVGLLACLFA